MSETSENLIPITKSELLANLKTIINGNIAIWRKNIDLKLVTIPLEKLKQYIGESAENYEFFIENDWQLKAASHAKNTPDQKLSSISYIKRYGEVQDNIKEFHLMSVTEREEVLDESIEKLHALTQGKIEFSLEYILKMVEVIANTFYTNYANLDDNLSSKNLKDNLTGIYIKTEWIIQIIITFFKDNTDAVKLLQTLDELKTGSYTIDQINKVLLIFINFCIFYNDYIDAGHVAKRIRGDFTVKYKEVYEKRLSIDEVTLEKIFKNGIRRIDPDKELKKFTLGALLYDIGKLADIDYHDSDAPYDEQTVKIHCLLSYNLITQTHEYPFIVSAIAAFHHEYYGGSGSYNFSNPLLSKLTNKKRTEENANYFISFEEKDFMDGDSLAFFPCKVIEIIDIFNALTSKKGQDYLNALKIMKKECIISELKIDPIIFEIFLDFLVSSEFIDESQRKELDTLTI